MKSCRLLAGALLATATLLAQAAPKEWSVTVLPSLGQYGSWGRALNNRGEVAGTSSVAEHHPHPVFWDSDGRITDLIAGLPASGVANALNDQGVVAFTNGSAVGVWKDGVAMYLGITGEPIDINKSGAVVGYFYPSGQIAVGPQRGFYYKDGVVHDIGSLGNNLTAAAGVNDRGVVVGYSVPPQSSDTRAVVWQDGVLRELTGLGGRNSSAGDVTNRGVIFGSADDVNGVNHLVSWDLNGNLLRDYGPRLAAHSVNDRGAIVGNHLDTGRPFLLEDDQFTWLLDLPAMKAQGFTAFSASEINDHGWIVGLGYRPNGPPDGVAVLLKPR
jgi:probable HAF family extracellular repeat protein